MINCTAEDTDVFACGSDWMVYHNTKKCFNFLDERRTWAQARDRCSSMEGIIAPIISAEEQLFIFGNTHCTY